LAERRKTATPSQIKEAEQRLKESRENLGIVQFGNGIHNPKYSIALLDSAIDGYKYTIGLLEGKDMSSEAVIEE